MNGTLQLRLRGPGGEPVDLRRTLDSHGFSDLAPLRLDVDTTTLALTVAMRRGRPRRIVIGPSRRGYARVEVLGTPPSEDASREIERAAVHVLRLDHDLSGFYAKAADDPDLAWVTAGAGRLLRSTTVFEDVVKTLCTTNCSWALTTKMTTALVSTLGAPVAGRNVDPLTHAFPTPAVMAAQDERFYREVIRAGYRAPHFVSLSRGVAAGEIDLESLGTAPPSELPDEEVERRLLELPGIGPYAAAHVMMTLGRWSRLVLDSWTRPTYARLVGRRTPPPDGSIERRFRRYGADAGLAFWLFVTRDWVS